MGQRSKVRHLNGESDGPRTQSQPDSGVTVFVPRLFDVSRRVQAATRHRPDEMGSCEEGQLLLQREQQALVCFWRGRVVTPNAPVWADAGYPVEA